MIQNSLEAQHIPILNFIKSDDQKQLFKSSTLLQLAVSGVEQPSLADS